MKTKQFQLQFATWLVVSSGFLVIQTAFLVMFHLEKVLTVWGQEMQMNIYLSEDAEGPALEIIKSKITENKKVSLVQYYSKEDTLNVFKKQIKSYAPDIPNDPELLKAVQANFQISLLPQLGAEEILTQLQSLAQEISPLKGVADVSYGQDWVKTFSTLFQILKNSFLFLSAVLLLAVFFVISNVIRSSIYQRRREIEVLELVGATPNFIRKPFLIESLTLSLSAFAFSTGIAFIFLRMVKTYLNSSSYFAQSAQLVQFFSLSQIALFALVAATMGMLSALLTLRKVNTGFAAAQGSQQAGPA